MKVYNNNWIDSFLYDKVVTDWISEATLRTYHTFFNDIQKTDFLDVENLSTFTELNAKHYLQYMIIEKWVTSHAYNRHLVLWRVFSEYLVKEKVIKTNPFHWIKKRKTEKKLPKFLPLDKVKELQKTINRLRLSPDYITVRNKSIVYFLLYTWVRLNELLTLKKENISIKWWVIKIVKGKGNKDRCIPLTSKLEELINLIIQTSDQEWIKSDFLFHSITWKPLRHKDVYRFFSKLNTYLSFNLTPHMLRHTYASELVRQNVNLYVIKQILWHEKIDTTQIYLNCDISNVTQELNIKNLFSVNI